MLIDCAVKDEGEKEEDARCLAAAVHSAKCVLCPVYFGVCPRVLTTANSVYQG